MDDMLARELQKALKKQGVKFFTGHKVTSVKTTTKEVTVTADDKKGNPVTFTGDYCLVSVGRRPYTDGLALDNAGVKVNENGQIETNDHLQTNISNIYAIGDVTSVGTPKAGIFAEGAARIAAESIIAEYNGYESSQAYDGAGSCYVEFGEGKVGRVDVDFFSNPNPTGTHVDASSALATEKRSFELSRKTRWFG